MCGIAGIVCTRDARIDEGRLREMTGRLRHRGDDARGWKIFPHAGLGHQRLSIIDLSTAADQPFGSADGRYWLTFNGEIYNFQELRRELEGRFTFRTTSDTEVLLHAFQAWGPACCHRFNGMFSFAIWDSRERRLFAARDRLGVKPFFYAWQDGTLVFASEAKALHAWPGLGRRIDERALVEYLSYGYVLGSRTIHRDVRRLEPGHWLECSSEGGLRIGRYWDPVEVVAAGGPEPTAEEIRDVLEGAVRRRLVSDVPVGFFLSGGIDSSAVVTLAARHHPDIFAFTLGFPEATYDERPHAERFLRDRGFRGESVDFQVPDEAFLRQLARVYDQPFADTSAVPTFQLSALAARRNKVVLSGDGGDEMFDGYETARADLLARLGQRLVPGWNLLLRGMAGWLGNQSADHDKVSTWYKLRQFARGAMLPLPEAHAWWRQLFTDDEVRTLLDPDLVRSVDGYRGFDAVRPRYKAARNLPLHRRHMVVDLQTWLADDILVKVDLASMAHGLEVRSPFLDLEVLKVAARVSFRRNVSLRGTKGALKQAMRGLLPDAVIDRAKEGFSSPVSRWLAGGLRPLFERVMQSEAVRAFFPRYEPIHDLLERHTRHEDNHGYRLWALFMFGLWAEAWGATR